MRGSIRKRLTLAFIGLAIGPLLLVGVILAWQSFITQEQQALNLQREVAQHVSSQVKAFLDGLENELRLVSQVQELQKLDRDKQRNILAELLSYQDAFESLVLLDSQGQEQVHLARASVTPAEELGNRAKADEFVIPRTSGQAYYSPIYFNETTGEPFITIAVPLFDVRTGLVDGVLVSEVRLERIWDLIMNLRTSPGQSVYIVDAQNKVVAHRNPSVVLRGTTFHVPNQDGIQPGLTGASAVLTVETARFGQQEFNVVAEQAVSEALALAITSMYVIAAIIVAALVVASSLGFLIVRQIVQPIQAMATTAQAISAGDLLQRVQITRQDELGVLARAFNNMTDQLRTLIHDLKKEVAEHRRTGEVLKENEERLRVALEGTTDGIWDWNLATGHVYFSPRYYTMMGYEPDEFPPAYESWRQLLHPDDAETVEKALWRAIEEQTPFAIESRFKAKNGAWRWILERGKVVEVDEEGKAVRVAGSHTDSTERKRAEEALQESEERYRILFENSPISLWEEDFSLVKGYFDELWSAGVADFRVFFENHPEAVTHCAGLVKVLDVNKATVALVGARNKDELLVGLSKLLADGAFVVFREELITLAEGGQWFESEETHRTLRGEERLVLKLSVVPGYAKSLGKVLVSVLDITERKQAEEEIRRLNEELEQRVMERTAQLEVANKELEAFSYSVSHDLRAPLRAIGGFSRILLEDYASQLRPEVAHYLRVIFENTQQMGRLIDDLLAFSRLSRQALNKQTIATGDLVRQVLQSLKDEEPGRQVEISMGALPACQGDPALLRQVWANLLSNALKFTRRQSEARIEIGCMEQNGEPVYFVKDNGVGFDIQYAGKLFGVFQRLHRAEEYEGTGVGLAIVQRIVRRHGGRVWAEAAPGEGATFCFTLK